MFKIVFAGAGLQPILPEQVCNLLRNVLCFAGAGLQPAP
jgi:hypothetical protein